MRNKNTLGKTRLPLLPTSNMPSLAEVRKKKTTHNDHQKKEKIEPYPKIRIEQKALSGLQNCVQIYIHKRHDRFFPRTVFCVSADVLQTFSTTQAIYDSCH